MVEILLDFIRADRDGNWTLPLEAFTVMLPWLTIYDHTNYARWGPVSLADMKLLEKTGPEVHSEFVSRSFVVKRINRRFNQVPADQATEWMNRLCNMQNGIIGITRNDQARDKFCVTWSERSRISQDTMSLLNQEDDEDEATFTHDGILPSRMKLDVDDVKKLVKQLTRVDVFKPRTTLAIGEDGENDNEATRIPLVSLATKDIASCDIVRDLLTAEDRGKQRLVNNANQRLTENTVGFHEALRKHNLKTFADLYKTNISSKLNVQKTIKADRKLPQRLINAVTSRPALQMGTF